VAVGTYVEETLVVINTIVHVDRRDVKVAVSGLTPRAKCTSTPSELLASPLETASFFERFPKFSFRLSVGKRARVSVRKSNRKSVRLSYGRCKCLVRHRRKSDQNCGDLHVVGFECGREEIEIDLMVFVFQSRLIARYIYLF